MGGIPDNYDELVGKALEEKRTARRAKERNRSLTGSLQFHRIRAGYLEKLAVEQKNASSSSDVEAR